MDQAIDGNEYILSVSPNLYFPIPFRFFHILFTFIGSCTGDTTIEVRYQGEVIH